MGSNQTKVKVGVCAMKKKSEGKPMKQLLEKMSEFYGGHIEIKVFEEKMITELPIEQWPVCDALIAFYSFGYPLKKVQSYVKMRNVWQINDISRQFDLLSRAKIYEILDKVGVATPKHEVLWRDKEHKEGTLKEMDDQIVVNDVVFKKPFVEKPVSSEDHDIRIYFPASAGGGCQYLYRKVNDRSSTYVKESVVRKSGSYLYEQFIQTEGTDIKVYSVGPEYAHAEARKGPALDGRVYRDEAGFEMRYPIILNQYEKTMARKIVTVFQQMVCGFDILRSDDNKSYVCDVNGFSFVKKSPAYCEDAARILGHEILKKFRPNVTSKELEFYCPEPTTVGKPMELRGVFAFLRHGDRTPKQKLKMEVRDARFQNLFDKNSSGKGEAKFKKVKQMQEILQVTRELLKEQAEGKQIFEDKEKLEQLKGCLELHKFTGINRKIQLRHEADDKPKMFSDKRVKKALVLIMKWGGELTEAGKVQAEELGKAFRCLYPGAGQYGSNSPGLGFLRLHNTYRHDLKIYASDEGRVQMTAAAFTKGLLGLEGELAPILIQMVKSSNMEKLLGDTDMEKQVQEDSKRVLDEILSLDRPLNKTEIQRINPTHDKSIQKILESIQSPKEMCKDLCNEIDEFIKLADSRKLTNIFIFNTSRLDCGETWQMFTSRWKQLQSDFVKSNESYAVLKVSSIYDNIKYDIQHNLEAFSAEEMKKLFRYSKVLADIIVPQNFGLSVVDKLTVGRSACSELLLKLKSDLKKCTEETNVDENVTQLDSLRSDGIASPNRRVRSRLYFTSQSHVHPLMNLLQHCSWLNQEDEQWSKAKDFLSYVTEFNYLSQFVVMLYEDTTKDKACNERFRVELHFSPGTSTLIKTTKLPLLGYRSSIEEMSVDESDSSKVDHIKPKSVYPLNELKRHENRLVSTGIVEGLLAPTEEDTQKKVPLLKSTAVFGFKGSNLLLIENKAAASAQIRLFIPPVRSLETLHNHLLLKQLNEFIDRATLQDQKMTEEVIDNINKPRSN